MKWKNFLVNIQNIKKESVHAVFVKINKEKMYFWHPKKLVRQCEKGKGYWLSFAYSDDFVFIVRDEKGGEIKEIKGDDILNYFEPVENYKKRFLSQEMDDTEKSEFIDNEF